MKRRDKIKETDLLWRLSRLGSLTSDLGTRLGLGHHLWRDVDRLLGQHVDDAARPQSLLLSPGRVQVLDNDGPALYGGLRLRLRLHLRLRLRLADRSYDGRSPAWSWWIDHLRLVLSSHNNLLLHCGGCGRLWSLL